MQRMLVIVISLFLFQTAGATDLAQIANLKNQILELSLQNTSSIENRPEVRTKLDRLIGQLSLQTSEVSENQWLTFAPGSWRQIWSDEADNSPAGAPKQNLEQIYQYVTPTGRAVNFGERIIDETTRSTFALEAVGSINGNQQKTTILKSFFRPTGLEANESLALLSQDILAEQNLIFSPFPTGEFPNGPIGAESDLTILYLDNELKIGTAPNVYTGAIELFILQRQEFVR